MASMDKLYSYCGDGQKTLLYIDNLKESHYGVFMRYILGENNEFKSVFWCDRRSQIDYFRFGDVLVFDATLKTNMYLKPLVILSGVNNHFQTTVFACAILKDEKNETYEWVLQCMMEAMNNKQPLSVITYGDLAMRSAIRKTFPKERHHLFPWHLWQNTDGNIKKGPDAHVRYPNDPDPKWQKGVKKDKTRQCGNCYQLGHNRTTCPNPPVD